MPGIETDVRIRKRVLDGLADMAAVVRDDNFRFCNLEESEPSLDTLKKLFNLSICLGLTKLLMVVDVQIDVVS